MRVYQQGEFYKYASIKRDGYQMICHASRDGVQLYTLSGGVMTLELAWANWYWRIVRNIARNLHDDLPINFYGELWLPGGTSTDIPRAIYTRNRLLRFDVWGMESQDGVEGYQELADFAILAGLETVPWFELSSQPALKSYSGSNCPPDFDSFAWRHYQDEEIKREDYLAFCGCDDVEGWVFSNGNMKDYCKLKQLISADLVVLGTVAGTGRNAGVLGSMIVGTVDGTILSNVSAGLTDAIRTGENPTGKVVEIAFGGFGSKGRLRFPRFVRFRPDKTPLEADTLESVRLIAKGGAQ